MSTINSVKKLSDLGQSPWYDYLSRRMVASGELERLLREDGLRGITSNPTIFDKAIAGGTDYDAAIADLTARGEDDPQKIFEHLAIEDVRRAADALMQVHKESGGADGFVSLEVSPALAHDTEGTVQEARRLWKALDRPNVMIKVPGTLEGLPAIEALTAEGICVNVTLLFSAKRYEQAAWAYIAGLERLAKAGGNLASVSSVASFFVSRIDTAVDKQLMDRMADLKKSKTPAPYQLLVGKTAVANAKVAYQKFKEIFSSARFQTLVSKGARPQRVLWASTGVKNPQYRDVLYIEELIGPDTVNTMPPAAWDAFRDHGIPEARLEKDIQDAQDVLMQLKEFQIDLDAVTAQLEIDGVRAFSQSYDSLLRAIDGKMQKTTNFQDAVKRTLQKLIQDRTIQRLYARDASLWQKDNPAIRNSLGWLNMPKWMMDQTSELAAFTEEIRKTGLTHILLLGMGGSSLAPEVFRRTVPSRPGFPALHVLDSTDPEAIRQISSQASPEQTLYIVSSKSGTTVEPLRLLDYFFAQSSQALGDAAGKHFVAITDPGSFLETFARKNNFCRVFLNPPDIGGRYSALSFFGLVPAALIGTDVPGLLKRAQRMMAACSGSDGENNPGLWLGAALAASLRQGRDKITFLISPELSGLDLWLEQLLAESTGKQGKGVIPISGEHIAAPEKYGKDRIFVRIQTEDFTDRTLDAFMQSLEQKGHPVLRLCLQSPLDLGAEFYRWEVATAVLGHAMQINPFDQPNVQEAKDRTNTLLDQLKRRGSPPAPKVSASDEIFSFSFSKTSGVQPKTKTVEEHFQNFLAQASPGDYIGLLIYAAPESPHQAILRKLQTHIFQGTGMPVQFGYGPRYLHSTGQLHKGGPNNGVFVILVRQDTPDIPIPGSPYSFGQLLHAQAIGDFCALDNAGCRALLIGVRGPIENAAKTISGWIYNSPKVPIHAASSSS